MGEVVLDDHHLREGAIDGRGREELHVRAEVVPPALHSVQLRHGRWGSIETREPMRRGSTASPTPTMRPDASCPRTSGRSTTNGPMRPWV